jgi:type III restriction enzyme
MKSSSDSRKITRISHTIERYKSEKSFCSDKKTKEDEFEAVDTTSRNAEERKAEKAAFELIMKNKEQLLSFDEPASFIFAHSALKEGWDNPNVFQICTLQHSYSETENDNVLGAGYVCVSTKMVSVS